MSLIIGTVAVFLGMFAVFGGICAGELNIEGNKASAKLGAIVSLAMMGMALALMWTI